jgi:hypothetical protein
VGWVLDFDARNTVLRVTVEGVVTDDSLLEVYGTVAKYFASHPPCRAVTDFSRVTRFDVSSDAIRRLAERAPAVPTGYTRVFVSSSDSVFGMARMFQILGEKSRPDLHVVRSLDGAYKLLQLESPEFSPVPTE